MMDGLHPRHRLLRRLPLLAILGAGAAHGAELILNGSIEQHHGLGLPFAWDFRKNAGSKVNADPAFARSGRRSLELDFSAADEPAGAFGFRPAGATGPASSTA